MSGVTTTDSCLGAKNEVCNNFTQRDIYMRFAAASLSISKAGGHPATECAFHQRLCSIPATAQRQTDRRHIRPHTSGVTCTQTDDPST